MKDFIITFDPGTRKWKLYRDDNYDFLLAQADSIEEILEIANKIEESK